MFSNWFVQPEGYKACNSCRRGQLLTKKSPRLQEGYRTTSKFANFSFNFSLAYKPQEIIYEIHSMGCELKNFEQTNHGIIMTGDL